MVMLPQPRVNASPLISEQLCALREHVTMRRFKVYKSFQQHIQKVKVQVTEKGRLPSNDGVVMDDSVGVVNDATPDPVHFKATSPLSLSVTPPPLSRDAMLDAQYLGSALECTNKLVAMTREGMADGWLEVGTKKNVHIMKKLPVEHGPVLNSIRGVGHIDVPPQFLLRILRDLSLTLKLDVMLKEIKVIHEISSAVHLVHLLYKPIWPTASRDFSTLSIAGQVDDSTWISSGMSIVDDRIPEEKGFVRAHLVSGGYVIQSVPGNPQSSLVTYSACVDIKGNIPGFAVNKVAESQPICIDLLRNLALSIYKEIKDDAQKMQRMEEEFPISLVDPNTAGAQINGVSGGASTNGDVSTNRATVNHGVVTLNNSHGDATTNGGIGGNGGSTIYNGGAAISTNGGVPLLIDRLSNTQWHFDASLHKESPLPSSVIDSLNDNQEVILGGNANIEEEEGYITPPMLGSEDETEDEVKGEGVEECDPDDVIHDPPPPPSISALNLALIPKYSLDGVDDLESSMDPNSLSLTNETISYPRHDSGQVDYRTLANQTAAHVLEEVFHVSHLDLSVPTIFRDQSGNWSFDGVEKEVLLFSKSSPNTSYTCFMGKGVIPLSPQFVFDSLRNPQLRFMYDNMLKELHIVRQIEEGLYILHLHHETTQCFIKQARDFCILVSERSEPNKKLLIGTSIETPECPPNPNLHRGKIYCSGWIVEPSHHINGKVGTQLTYLLRVDMGGVPSSLMNYIAKRQPLAVAYIRDYLMSTSLEHDQ